MRSSLFRAYFSRFSSEVCYYNLSPQGDGNKYILSYSFSFQNYNLSPQGDGNTLVVTLASNARRLQLIPARGRKHDDARDGRTHAVITTYPRKGTETGSQLK